MDKDFQICPPLVSQVVNNNVELTVHKLAHHLHTVSVQAMHKSVELTLHKLAHYLHTVSGQAMHKSVELILAHSQISANIKLIT